MRSARAVAALLPLLLLAPACRGKGGPAGPQGQIGPRGPISPVDPAPQILSVEPPIASPGTLVRIRLAALATAQTVVYFDGVPADTEFADAAGDLWAKGFATVGAPFVDVAVDVGGRLSNSVTLARGASGELRPLASGGLSAAGGLVLSTDAQTIYVLDAQTGIARFDLAAGALSSFGTSVALHPRAGVADGTDLLVIDSSPQGRIVRVKPDGTVLAEVTGIGANPTGLARDTDGTLYWAVGTTIGRRAPNGAVTASFATVPGSDQLAIVGANLYVSDPGNSAIHRVALPGGAVTASFVSGAAGRGLTSDGTDLYLCTADGASAALKVTTAGATSVAAPSHPVAGAATPACLFAAGALWDANVHDGALESSTANAAWKLRAPSLARDVGQGLWVGERFFVAAGAGRCAAGGSGAVAELGTGGSLLVVDADACANGTLAVDPAVAPAAIFWADTRGTKVRRVSLSTGAVSDAVSDAGLAAASGLAISDVDGSFLVGVPGGTPRVARYSAAGVLVSANVDAAVDASPAGTAVSAGELYVSMPTRIVRLDLNANGSISQPVAIAGSAQSLSGFGAIAPLSEGGVVFAAGSDAFSLDGVDAIHFLGAVSPGGGLGETPWGEVLETQASDYPMARIP